MTTLIESPASSAPIRLVFDANVLISAALTGAQAGYALTLVTEGTLRGIVSEPILAEVERKLTEKFQRTPAEVTQQLDSFRQILDVVKPVPVRSPTLRDQRDRHVLGTAIASGAALILTSDRDLLTLRRFKDIGIIHPKTLRWTFPKRVTVPRSLAECRR